MLTTVLAFLAAPGSVVACTCASMPRPPCDTTWASGEVIFLGTAASIVDLTDHEVRFSSVEIFRGAAQPDKTITVHAGYGLGDCAYPFAAGNRYLVYASTFKGQFTTNICTQTAPAEMADAPIRQLGKLRETGRSDDVFGTVATGRTRVRFEHLSTINPLANIGVHAATESGPRFSTVTDEHGGYAFASLPRGEYAIQADLPPGLHPDRGLTVNLRDAYELAGCRADYSARPDGRISGRVTDASGAAVPGFITVKAFDREKGSEIRQQGGLPGQLTNDGRFSLELLPPGAYRLIFHPKDGNRIDVYRTAWWPTDGSLLDLALGEHVDNVKFEVSATTLGR